MKLALSWFALALLVSAAPVNAQAGATDFGVPFQLPQARNSVTGRRSGVENSNALTISWDGRLLMYVDERSQVWPPNTQADPIGFVFATFDPMAVKPGPSGPDFTECFGTPFPRFASLKETVGPTGGNSYPNYPLYPGGYPVVANTLGELGLLRHQNLSNNMYPVPPSELPPAAFGHNPYRSNSSGSPSATGECLTYRAQVTFQDLPKFWSSTQGKWLSYDHLAHGNANEPLSLYQAGTYPNGQTVVWTSEQIKRNGIAQLEIVVNLQQHTVLEVEVLQKWQPFRVSGTGSWGTHTAPINQIGMSVPSDTEMWADNFEPVLTLDGHLMVAKGSPKLCNRIGNTSQVVFYYNQSPFGVAGWQGPWELHHLYLHRNDDIAGRTIAERYPISRHPLKDYDGKVFADLAPYDGELTLAEANGSGVHFEGGYTWLDPDGRYLLFSVFTGGVGPNHPEYPLNSTFNDGGGSSNRGQSSIVGSVTGWQMWRIDHAAENPGRHLYTAWDQDSRTTHQRSASFGFGPGFWELLRGAPGLPVRDDGRTKLQLINSQRLLYYELDLSAYQERDYGFYLPMTELLTLNTSYWNPPFRNVDIARTPDLSGNGHFANVDGGQLPCEYFELPTNISSDVSAGMQVPGLHIGASTPAQIHTTWNASNAIQSPGTGLYWAPIADWKDGKDPDGDGTYTAAYAGRGIAKDMDSDTCWGRVGQAMFFRNQTKVSVPNVGVPPELNPGSAISGASGELTVSFWLYPLQARTAPTSLFEHNVTLALAQNGAILATVQGSNGNSSLSSAGSAAPNGTWTHVALTWNDISVENMSEARLYVNGVQVDEELAAPFDTLQTSSQDIRIGCLTCCSVAR
jgi:hypothetical protein